jgi:hypothetical protein
MPKRSAAARMRALSASVGMEGSNGAVRAVAQASTKPSKPAGVQMHQIARGIGGRIAERVFRASRQHDRRAWQQAMMLAIYGDIERAFEHDESLIFMFMPMQRRGAAGGGKDFEQTPGVVGAGARDEDAGV